MESIIFDIISYCFLGVAAISILYVVLSYSIHFVIQVFWTWFDEGDSKPLNVLEKVTPECFKTISSTEISNCDWKIKHLEGHGYYFSLGYHFEKVMGENGNPVNTSPHSTNCRVQDEAKFFTTEQEALDCLDKRQFYSDTKNNICLFGFNGVVLGSSGFYLFHYIPTIALYTGSVLLSLYGLKYGRKMYKKWKKMNEAFDNHVKDKSAHK